MTPPTSSLFLFLFVMLLGFSGSYIIRKLLGIRYQRGVSSVSVFLYDFFFIVVGILLKISLDLPPLQE